MKIASYHTLISSIPKTHSGSSASQHPLLISLLHVVTKFLVSLVFIYVISTSSLLLQSSYANVASGFTTYGDSSGSNYSLVRSRELQSYSTSWSIWKSSFFFISSLLLASVTLVASVTLCTSSFFIVHYYFLLSSSFITPSLNKHWIFPTLGLHPGPSSYISSPYPSR